MNHIKGFKKYNEEVEASDWKFLIEPLVEILILVIIPLLWWGIKNGVYFSNKLFFNTITKLITTISPKARKSVERAQRAIDKFSSENQQKNFIRNAELIEKLTKDDKILNWIKIIMKEYSLNNSFYKSVECRKAVEELSEYLNQKGLYKELEDLKSATRGFSSTILNFQDEISK